MTRGARVVAIDGPAGAGKSSASRALAARLGFAYVDTGTMYRIAGLVAHDRGVALDDDAALDRLLGELSFTLTADGVESDVVPDRARTRTVEAGELASRVSTRTIVRRRLVELQRRLAEAGDVVMEGRDIGTVVCPDAPLKVFLTASPQERARRRAADLRGRGERVDVEALAVELARRDTRDRSRADSPLRPAADARVLDTTGLSLAQVVDRLVLWARESLDPEGCT